MVSAVGETQVLDADSPPSDCKDSDGGGDENPLLFGETQQLHDPDTADDVANLDIWGRTQLVDEWGETAAVDCGEATEETDIWGRTQLVDAWDETATVDCGETTEETEVMTQGKDEESDDGANCGPPRERAICSMVDDGGREERRKKDYWVDSDASTDDETDCKASDGNSGKNPSLCGKTQPLHDVHSADDIPSLDIWGKTQLVYAWEETAPVDSEGKETINRMEMMIHDEDDASNYGANCCPQDEGVIDCMDNGVSEEGKKDNRVDPDASTDDEAGSSPYVGHSEQVNDIAAQTGMVFSRINNLANNRKDPSSFCLGVGQINQDNEIENSGESIQKFSKERDMGKHSDVNVKDLMNEVKSCEKNEGTTKVDKIVVNEDLPHLLTSKSGVSRLRYIGSQEPSMLSQANALEAIDKLLSVDCVGSSQEAKNNNTDRMSPLPVSHQKGAQIFAEKMCHGIPSGKVDIFDWNDGLEDVGGGVLCKRKGSLFSGICDTKQIKSHTYKSSHTICDIMKGGLNNSAEMGGTPSKTCMKTTTLLQSDSRMSQRVHISLKMAEKESVLKDTDAGPRSLVLQVETPDVDVGSQCKYVVGSDTQMAAETLEALFHIIPVNLETKDDIHPEDGILIKKSTKNPTMERGSSNISLKRRISTRGRKEYSMKSCNISPHAPGDVSNKTGRSSKSSTAAVEEKRRKRRKEYSMKSCNISPHAPGDLSNKTERSLKDSTAAVEEKRRKRRKEYLMKPCNISPHAPGDLSNKTEKSSKDSIAAVEEKRRKLKLNGCLEVDATFGHPKRRRTNRVASRNLNANINKPLVFTANDADQKGKAEGFPFGGIEASAAYKRNAISPVFVVQDPPRLCDKRLSSPLDCTERLEAIVAPSTPLPKDVRRRKDMASICVLLSRHLDEDTIKHQKKILTRLGLRMASLISDATHFVTDKFVRTQNMLEAIASGKPVVTPMWLESCRLANFFIDEKNYILRDVKKEKEIGFNMSVSLSLARRCPLLQGLKLFVTPNVKPSQKVITSLVKASCGQEIKTIGTSAIIQDNILDDLLVIACEEDYSDCIPLLKKGVHAFSSELLLNGIVIQKLEYERHQLFRITQQCG